MATLNTDQIASCSQVFQESLSHVISNSIGDTRQHIQHFIANVILKEKPYLLVTEEGIQHAINLTFSDERTRDFVFMLSFTFFSRWGGTHQDIDSLSENLAIGVTHAYRGHPLNAVPTQIGDRLTSFEEAAQLISVNRWLIILLMLQLTITIEPEKEQRVGYPPVSP